MSAAFPTPDATKPRIKYPDNGSIYQSQRQFPEDALAITAHDYIQEKITAVKQ